MYNLTFPMAHRLISFLYILMEREDQSLCVTIAEVLALILDIDRLYKFSEENSCTSIDSLKSQLSEKFKKLPTESNSGNNTNAKNSEEEFLHSVLFYIEVILLRLYDLSIMHNS